MLGTVSNEALVGIIVLLVAAHFVRMEYRQHTMDGKLEKMREEFTASILKAAVAAATASQALAAAAQNIAKNGHKQ